MSSWSPPHVCSLLGSTMLRFLRCQAKHHPDGHDQISGHRHVPTHQTVPAFWGEVLPKRRSTAIGPRDGTEPRSVRRALQLGSARMGSERQEGRVVGDASSNRFRSAGDQPGDQRVRSGEARLRSLREVKMLRTQTHRCPAGHTSKADPGIYWITFNPLLGKRTPNAPENEQDERRFAVYIYIYGKLRKSKRVIGERLLWKGLESHMPFMWKVFWGLVARTATNWSTNYCAFTDSIHGGSWKSSAK